MVDARVDWEITVHHRLEGSRLVGREGFEPPMSLWTPDLQSGALPLCHLPKASIERGTDRANDVHFKPRGDSRERIDPAAYRAVFNVHP